MQRTRSNGLLALVAVIAAAAGYFAQHHFLPTGSDGPLGSRRSDFTLPDLDGRPRSIGEFDGKVIVLNFWATWYPPCRKEIPDFVALHAEYAPRGVQFLGIANDEPDQVRSFIKEVPLNYLTLVGDLDGQIGRAYGNEMGALPYTVVIDARGNIAAAHRGLYTRQELEALLQRLL